MFREIHQHSAPVFLKFSTLSIIFDGKEINSHQSQANIFLSWHAAMSFIKYVTLESFIPTSMLSIIILTMRLGVTLNVSEVPYVRIDTATWRHFPRHLVWFFSAAAFVELKCALLKKFLRVQNISILFFDSLRGSSTHRSWSSHGYDHNSV